MIVEETGCALNILNMTSCKTFVDDRPLVFVLTLYVTYDDTCENVNTPSDRCRCWSPVTTMRCLSGYESASFGVYLSLYVCSRISTACATWQSTQNGSWLLVLYFKCRVQDHWTRAYVGAWFSPLVFRMPRKSQSRACWNRPTTLFCLLL